MNNNPLLTLGQLGQSPWYDYITRELLKSGRLTKLITDDGLRGMTSNPTIFEKAISGSEDYDEDIRRLLASAQEPAEIFDALSIADVRAACDSFRPTYEALSGHDGLVSIEVNPELAGDTQASIAEAARLWKAVSRPNLMVKIPGTAAGIPAIEESLAAGININITLLFSVDRYLEVSEAFLRGLERRRAAGQPIDRLASVASFFVSRVDAKVDPLLDQQGDSAGLRGTIAIANAATAYAAFQRSRETPRWQALAAAGARPQRPLWASTSTKDPRYSDTHYIEPLVAPHTVTTLPPETLDAYRDHGKPEIRIATTIAQAPDRLRALAAQGIDLAEITRSLEVEGVAKFAESYQKLLRGIEAKAAALVGER
ncbi:MAG TPA: transaldolase [Gemmatimonadales bacterium]|jgi:transaldolase|nr:transaldolase [Gemmatimonadales bacterium]